MGNHAARVVLHVQLGGNHPRNVAHSKSGYPLFNRPADARTRLAPGAGHNSCQAITSDNADWLRTNDSHWSAVVFRRSSAQCSKRMVSNQILTVACCRRERSGISLPYEALGRSLGRCLIGTATDPLLRLVVTAILDLDRDMWALDRLRLV
jgi:hypothetical protein